MNRAHCFQHVPFEGLGSIEPWLHAHDFTVATTRFFAGESLPRLNDVDLLLVMGGPMSVNDERELPWLVDEKRFVREAIAAGKPVLGICLGAQLIACAMGARVYPNRVKEIGWRPVFGTPSDDLSLFRFPSKTEVFHWHGETFDLPPGATRLARSEHCENQAFQLGCRTLGLQFHLETTPDSARALVEHCRHELVPSATVQDEAALLAAPASAYARINALMGSVLEFLTS